MVINLTLVVQMVHFAIAYYVLKIIFLQPAVAAIHKQDDHDAHLRAVLSAQRKKLAEQEEGQRLQWRYLKRLLQAEKPTIDGMKIPFSMPVVQSWQSMVQKKQLYLMTQEVKDALVTRLSHD